MIKGINPTVPKVVSIEVPAVDFDVIMAEHLEMVRLLARSVDVMRITQRLFQLSNDYVLMEHCRSIERWLSEHQKP